MAVNHLKRVAYDTAIMSHYCWLASPTAESPKNFPLQEHSLSLSRPVTSYCVIFMTTVPLLYYFFILLTP